MNKLAVLSALVLSGCASAMYQGMTAEQITAAAKDNKAVYQCADVPVFAGGTAKIRSMVIDANVIRSGGMTAKTCDDITFTNDSNKPVAPKAAP